MAIKDNDYDDTITAMINDPMFSKILRNMLMQGDVDRRAMERETHQDPFELMDEFRNEGYRPGGTGKVHFMGGSPFPQSPGQERGEKVAAIGAFSGNMLDSLNSVVPAIVDAWRNRKKPQGGQG